MGKLAIGERETAFKWAREVLESDTKRSVLLYNTACFYSQAGEIDIAFEALERSLAAGKSDADWLRQDSDLDNIRDDPRFQDILERMEKGT